MDVADARATGRLAAVGLAASVGGGLLYVPEHVGPVVGPSAPLAYLVAGGAMACVFAAFAVLASGPFARDGLAFHAVSEASGSRALGFLATWPAAAAYVGLLALLADWLGHLGPLPPGAGTWVRGTVGGPTPLAALLGVAVTPGLADALAVAACAVAFGVHATGARRASLAVAAATLAALCPLVAGLLLAFVPGVGEFVPGNFDPLFPASDLRRAPVAHLAAGTGAAAFAFVGLEAVASAGSGATDRRVAPRALLVAAAVAVGTVTLTALVALGVVDWVRLSLADVPAADAMAAYLPVDPGVATTAASLVLAGAGLLALGFPATRTLAGFGDLLPPLGRREGGSPVVALGVTYGVAAGLCVTDLVAPALYLAVPGLALSYLAVVVTVLALPRVRPERWAACSLRPGPRLRVGLGAGGLLGSGVLVAVPLVRDPATVLSWTLQRVALAVFEFELVHAPLASAVPALVAWEFLGAVLLLVARDYRESQVEPPD